MGAYAVIIKFCVVMKIYHCTKFGIVWLTEMKSVMLFPYGEQVNAESVSNKIFIIKISLGNGTARVSAFHLVVTVV